MKNILLTSLLIFFFMVISGQIVAETVYVTDNLNVGLHQENTADSPIIKLMPTGTALEVIKKENNFIQVKEPDGKTGWIDARYLLDTPPAINLVYNLRQKITVLEAELETLKSGQGIQTTDTNIQNNADKLQKQIKELRIQNAELEQKYKTERLTVGELQAKLAELRNQITEYADQHYLNEKVEQLSETNTELEQQISQMNTQIPASGNGLMINNWKKLAVYLAITFIIGLLLGLYILDLYHRRRHGGFRI